MQAHTSTSHYEGLTLKQYKNWNPDEAVRDYYSRIQNHEQHYETIDDLTWPYIKIVNVRPIIHIYRVQLNCFLGWRKDHVECELEGLKSINC